MTVKEIIEKIAVLREALRQAKSPEECMSIQFEINRLENLKAEGKQR